MLRITSLMCRTRTVPFLKFIPVKSYCYQLQLCSVEPFKWWILGAHDLTLVLHPYVDHVVPRNKQIV